MSGPVDGAAKHEALISEPTNASYQSSDPGLDVERLARAMENVANPLTSEIEDPAELAAEYGRLLDERIAMWARWIVGQTRRTDWACRECVDADVRGQDNMVIPGFVCVWHSARAALKAREETRDG